MLRTLEPDSGIILFDGMAEEELSLDWIRKQIALVPQDPFLFFGTIADNLRMAKEDATDAELMAALEGRRALGLRQCLAGWTRYQGRRSGHGAAAAARPSAWPLRARC